MSSFTPSGSGAFLQRDGPAKRAGRKPCRRKLCFAATDLAYLAAVLGELAERDDCYFVKYSVRPRDGMHLGRCFLDDEDRVGELWRRFKSDAKLLCTVQDDHFLERFREA